ncbi:MAG TPA: hypothetical protein VHM69_14620 [Rubrobacter sp.]|nr:hypothetical protein [Rubrobacter sp.]
MTRRLLACGVIAGPLYVIGAGIFIADPMGGFPPGTPQNAGTVSCTS